MLLKEPWNICIFEIQKTIWWIYYFYRNVKFHVYWVNCDLKLGVIAEDIFYWPKKLHLPSCLFLTFVFETSLSKWMTLSEAPRGILSWLITAVMNKGLRESPKQRSFWTYCKNFSSLKSRWSSQEMKKVKGLSKNLVITF